MRIVVLDGQTLNPGDLSWSALEKLGDCQVYDGTPAEQVVSRSEGVDALIINKIELNRDTIDALGQLKYVGVTATGYNVVDLAAARARGVVVTNVPTYGTQSVVQVVFAHLLELCHHVGHHSRTVRDGKWCECESFCYWDRPLVELESLTMGIIGYGRIGRATAKLAGAFGMKVIAYHPIVDHIAEPDVPQVELDELFKISDVVSLHCPLNANNKGMVNAQRLMLMKETAFLINTARGPLVNEQDLADALNSGQIAGAGLDVLSAEPPRRDNPLLNAKNCYITPHLAWATRSARQRLMQTTISNLRAFLAGKPVNVVN
jgi:glycerate dehydrogenase